MDETIVILKVESLRQRVQGDLTASSVHQDRKYMWCFGPRAGTFDGAPVPR